MGITAARSGRGKAPSCEYFSLKFCVRTILVAVLAISGLAITTSLPAGAAVGTCGDFTFVNNLDEDIKVKEVTDGREHTRHRLSPDRSVTVAIDEGEEWTVRKPSNAELVWRGPESCPADGTETVVIDAGPQPGFVCGTERNAGMIIFTVHWFNVPDGTRIALNLERGVRPNEDYIFLGTHDRTAQTTVIEVAEPPGLSGEWLTKARLKFHEGTRTPPAELWHYRFQPERSWPAATRSAHMLRL